MALGPGQCGVGSGVQGWAEGPEGQVGGPGPVVGLGSRSGQKIEGQVPGVGLGSMGIERILKGRRHCGSGVWVGSEGLLRGGIGPRVLRGSERVGSTGVQVSGGVVRGS